MRQGDREIAMRLQGFDFQGWGGADCKNAVLPIARDSSGMTPANILIPMEWECKASFV
jgi:hypothetical protein